MNDQEGFLNKYKDVTPLILFQHLFCTFVMSSEYLSGNVHFPTHIIKPIGWNGYHNFLDVSEYHVPRDHQEKMIILNHLCYFNIKIYRL